MTRLDVRKSPPDAHPASAPSAATKTTSASTRFKEASRPTGPHPWQDYARRSLERISHFLLLYSDSDNTFDNISECSCRSCSIASS